VKYLRRHGGDYDLIHDNQSLSYGMLEIQDMGLPLVTTLHHPITSDLRIALNAARNPWEKLLIRRWHSFLRMQTRVVRQLRNIVTVSDCSRQDIARDFGLQPAGISLVHNGIDTEVFRPLPGVDRNPMRLMATCSADAPLKGLRYLLKAYTSLQQTDRKADTSAGPHRADTVCIRYQHRADGALLRRGKHRRGAFRIRGLRPARG
jgi:glycosyltransferase involved in cell wall biosynthesis